MPPKVRFTRADIVAAALRVARRGGASALNARAIAEELGCSTQPLYRELRNMDEIRQAVLEEARKLYAARVAGSMGIAETPYKSVGVAMLRFANEEKELFKLLFMRDRDERALLEDENDKGLQYAKAAIANTYHITHEQAAAFQLHMSVYTHGLAVMVATNYIPYDERVLSDALTVEFRALMLLIEQGQPL